MKRLIAIIALLTAFAAGAYSQPKTIKVGKVTFEKSFERTECTTLYRFVDSYESRAIRKLYVQNQNDPVFLEFKRKLEQSPLNEKYRLELEFNQGFHTLNLCLTNRKKENTRRPEDGRDNDLIY